MFHRTVSYNSVTINDRTSIDSKWASGVGYYISVENADGIYGADIAYESHPIPNATGEVAADIFRRGKGITLSGIIVARTLALLDTGAQKLQEAFWTRTAHALQWTTLSDNVSVYVTARVNNDLSVTMTKQTGGNRQWTWTVGLRADDPRIRLTSGGAIYKSFQS